MEEDRDGGAEVVEKRGQKDSLLRGEGGSLLVRPIQLVIPLVVDKDGGGRERSLELSMSLNVREVFISVSNKEDVGAYTVFCFFLRFPQQICCHSVVFQLSECSYTALRSLHHTLLLYHSECGSTLKKLSALLAGV